MLRWSGHYGFSVLVHFFRSKLLVLVCLSPSEFDFGRRRMHVAQRHLAGSTRSEADARVRRRRFFFKADEEDDVNIYY